MSDTPIELSGTIKLTLVPNKDLPPPIQSQNWDTYKVSGFLSRETPPTPVKRMKVGINLGDPTYWEPTFPFNDLVKYANHLSSGTYVLAPKDNPAPPGKYILSWIGGSAPTIRPATNYEAHDQQRYVDITSHKGKNLLLVPGEWNTKLKVVPINYQTNHGIHPEFLSDISWADHIRFMVWLKTNNSPIVNFYDWTDLEEQSWHKKPVPLELVVDVCNRSQTDCLFNIPHAATDQCIDETVQFLDAKLDTNLALKISWSNEIGWNWAPPFRDQFDFAKSLPPVPDQYFDTSKTKPDNLALRIAHKTWQVWTHAENAISSQRKLVKVGSGQWNFREEPGKGAGVHRTKVMSYHNFYREQMDEYELGIYYGSRAFGLANKPDWEFGPLSEMFTDLDKERWEQEAGEHLQFHKQALNNDQVKLTTYECGNHYNHKFDPNQATQWQEFHRNPELGRDAYKFHLEMLERIGISSACIFNSHSSWTDNGKAFGIMSKRGDKQSPPYLGIQDFLQKNKTS